MKNIIKIIALLFITAFYGQTQFGIIAEVNSTTLKTTDLYGVDNGGIGYGFGITTLSSLYQSSDLIAEMYITSKKVSAKGYFDYYDEPVDFIDTDFKVFDINVNFLWNQYIIIPDRNNFHIAVQGGFGIAILNDWATSGDENNFFYDRTNPLNAFYIIGVSGGTEQLRATLRYNGYLTNPLRDVVESEFDDHSSASVDGRKFDANLGTISLSVSYYFDLFGNN